MAAIGASPPDTGRLLITPPGGSYSSQKVHVEALEWINEVVRKDGKTQFDLGFAPDKPGLIARRIIYRFAMKEARPV